MAGLLTTFAALNGLAGIAHAAPITWTGDRPDALAGSGPLTARCGAGCRCCGLARIDGVSRPRVLD